MNTPIKNIVFDLGGVLIDWNPRYLYRKIFSSEEQMEYFLESVCSQHWNEQQDAGRPFSKATAELIEKFPHFKSEIQAYDLRWEEMLSGPIDSSVKLLEKLSINKRYRLLALSNWSQEKFGIAENRFSFLKLFEDIVVSGRVGLKKPDPQIFQFLCTRHQITPQDTIFIDDSVVNIQSASQLGFRALHYKCTDELEGQLIKLGVM
jgi:2-haloacid dehalogenase